MTDRPDLPILTPVDQDEMVLIERHAALAGFFAQELRQWEIPESQRDQIMYAWSSDWWGRE